MIRTRRAGIGCETSDPVITNDTITGNTATSRGGGIWCSGSDPAVTNTIVWGDTAPQGPEIDLETGSSPTITYCDVGGGWPGTGNIDADPLFVESAAGDYHILFDSPCRDGGDYKAPAVPEKDFEGDRRDPCGIPDMGADEFWSHLYCMGDIVPGAPCSVRITATPGVKAWFVTGSGLLDPPFPSPYGDLYLRPPYRFVYLGGVPSGGVLVEGATVPPGWGSGESHYFQALLEWLPPLSYLYLSNLMALTVP